MPQYRSMVLVVEGARMAVSHRRTVAAIFVSIGLSCALVLGPPAVTAVRSTVTLVNTVIGLGGRGDAAGIRVQDKLSAGVVPAGYGYIGCWYPADLNMINSVLVGMPNLREHLANAPGKVLIAGYSEGTLLAEQIKRDLKDDPNRPDTQSLIFLQIAAPFIPNGGILARFPVLGIPGLIPAMGVATPSMYGTTYITKEYDPYADFPAYFNPLALLNTLLAIEYAHPDRVYDVVDSVGIDNFTKEVTNTAHGVDKYILVPSAQLPLLGPVRDIARTLHLTPLTDRLLGAIEPLLRVMIDMAYTDREYLGPEIHTPFSLFTPPHKIIEALNAVPGAVREGVDNLLGITRTPAAPAVAPPAPEAAAQPASQPASRPESPVQSETAPEDDATSDDDELEAPPSARKTPGRPVVTLRDGPRSAFGGNRTAPKTAQSPARSERSGQDTRDAGAEAA